MFGLMHSCHSCIGVKFRTSKTYSFWGVALHNTPLFCVGYIEHLHSKKCCPENNKSLGKSDALTQT